MKNYGIDEVNWMDCFRFIFQSKYSLFLLVLFFVTLFLSLMYGSGMIRVSGAGNEKRLVTISIPANKGWLTYEHIWLICGVCSVIGTIVASKLISFLFFPIICLRYLYPSFIMIWLVFGICLSSFPGKKVLPLLLSCIIVFTGLPAYLHTVKDEIGTEKILNETMDVTSGIGQTSRIITDISHLGHLHETSSGNFCWTVGEVYYPDSPVQVFDGSNIPKLNSSEDNWLFLSEAISAEIQGRLNEQGLSAELVKGNGRVGTYLTWVYRIKKK